MATKEVMNEPIAIVGSACRFAGGASSPSKLWKLLQEPRDVLSEIPNSRFNAEGQYHPNSAYHGHSNVRHSYLLEENVAAFDTEFFGIKPIEAKAIDPQQRILMETVYEGMEAAGLTIDSLRGSDTAVYVGVMCNDYESLLLRDMNTAPTYTATGIGKSILSNRISYFFDFHGPSVTLDTACSSSLVAIHMAVQSLRSGESRVALACGSNLCLGPENYVIESKLKMLSPDGRSRMWSSDANGYARGDGVASCVLKTLKSALEDGDDIECIIRETGVNQDGATTGITMPSATAQKALIKSTYAKAGLDVSKKSDRPQFFEAHGTGTPAGDPIEAEAISTAFFGEKYAVKVDGDPLYVGSIKTVLGHTEGTAGVAAVMKASLALKHSVIPPNMLLKQLSDRVAPFTANLEIIKKPRSWPEVLPGQPRRASVNSFGFGGTNAHAILESYDPPQSSGDSAEPIDGSALFSPLTFSAISRQSLYDSLTAYGYYIHNNPSLKLRDLAYTLQKRRSAFPFRISFAASSTDDLVSKMSSELEGKNPGDVGIKTLSTSHRGQAKILGVFTGQGAQYARMGAELIEQSATARQIMRELQSHLDQLPSQDRPDWSLEAKLLASSESSRVSAAAFSQPLCTAVQILLIDIMKLAGVKFDAVVGHSSGEIAAAYAAGFLTARDAILIAYFRGQHVSKLKSPNGIKGAMLAAGMSQEDAQALCEDEEFAGRIGIAAVNSSSSITFSGDEDAIDELQIVLDDEKRFNRKLRVDQAYHSHHMLPCYNPYIESVQKYGVKALEPVSKTCTWISSVYGRPVTSDMALSDAYWSENMTKPVLFFQALSKTLGAAEYDLAIEVGPHPALKGPASQIIQEVLGKSIPYQGTLSRGSSAVSSIASCLGFLWSNLGESDIDLNAYEVAMNDDKSAMRVLKDLPSYQWNHDGSYWHESRALTKIRTQAQPFNQLLGNMLPDSAPHRLSWGHLLRASEIEWLPGHQVQNQVVYPAAGYICTALEAARVLSGTREIRLFELKDFIIHQAIAFNQDDAGIEILTSLSDVRHPSKNCIEAKFTYSAGSGSAEDMALVAEAELQIILGPPSATTLPKRAIAPPHMISVDSQRFYNDLLALGYGFDGPFRSLSTMKRKHGVSICGVNPVPREPYGQPLLVHPAEFDAAIQSIILANSYPGDDQLLTMHLPTSIGRILINPSLCASMAKIEVDSKLGVPRGQGFLGHVNLYAEDARHAAIQIEHVELVPLGGMTVANDRKVFSKNHWVKSSLDGEAAACDTVVTQYHEDVLTALERISIYYLKQFDLQVPADSPLRSESQNSHYLRYARHITSLVESGKHKLAKKEWLNDSLETMLEATAQFSDIPDARVMHLVGQQMPRVFKGETNMLEEFRTSNVLDDYYAGGFGFLQSGLWLSRTISQLAERYPHLKILEIGAGTGGATKRILKHLGSNFLSYTFTDVSSGFFEKGAEVFAAYKNRMVFKTFDCGQDPLSQGYEEGSYDVLVASLVIHATPDLELTMRNLRKLVRPGGFLVVADGSNNGQPHGTGGFIFGPLPGWWLGADQGRPLSPFVSTAEWDRLLKVSGFSGIDSTAPKAFEDIIGMTVFASQAVDDKINFLREPLVPAVSNVVAPIKKLVIVGGKTERTASLIKAVRVFLDEFSLQLRTFETLIAVDHNLIDADTTVVCLTELDAPIFKDLTAETFSALQKMFTGEKKLIWVTGGRLYKEPFSNMTVGFGRTAVHESPLLQYQTIDIADTNSLEPRNLAETILRFQALTSLADGEESQLLWAREHEISIDAEGRELVPRLRPVVARNDRYNSARRPITHDVNIKETPAVLQKSADGWLLKEISRFGIPPHSDSRIKIVVSHAVVSALSTSHGPKSLILGTEYKSQERFLALVPSLLSVVSVPKGSAFPCPVSKLPDADLLTVLAAQLVSMAIVDPLLGGETMVVHNPTELLASAITVQASKKNVRVLLMKDSAQEHLPDSWTTLAPYTMQSEINRVLPANTTYFVGLSNHAVERSENEATILSTLPPHCRRETAATLYLPDGWESNYSSPADMLRRALADSENVKNQGQNSNSETISLDNLIGGSNPVNPVAIIDWTLSGSYPVHVSRLDSAAMFKGDKTYWMCGLSGALGVSLCDWMIERGARCLVLTSRNPNIAPAWIEAHKRNGINVTIIPCDVTNEPALQAAHQTICKTLPPIVGVLNGAMVLRDVSIQNMEFEQMRDVFRPKVYGSIHLDRIFAHENLDFFILFSSINCVIGNSGQANYSAANTFMCSLAAQRKKRGLAATALNVGAIIGAGYMERESSKALDLMVANMALMHLSEQDYHQLFAEGIDAGRPDSGDEAELTTGLLETSVDDANAPKWHGNPTFSAFTVHELKKDGGDTGNENAVSIKEQLSGCTSPNEVLEVIRRAFSVQLRNSLQMKSADEDLMSMRSTELGLDSLISVDIRSWFLKNFEVSVPVLKILGNDTMANLAELVAESVPPNLVPGLNGSASSIEGTTVGNADRASEGSSSPIDSPEDARSTESTSNSTGASTPAIDWEAETTLPEAAMQAQFSGANVPAPQPHVILLTGVSGLLGSHLLSHLLKEPSINKVICIAVRRLAERLEHNELPLDSRIQYFEGDLQQHRLGLSEDEAANIFSEVDAVIHNGADTSHLKFYPAIRGANAGSTRELISLCMTRKIPIHFISTVGVSLFGNYKTFPPISAASNFPPADGSHGYIAAKWASERLLERLNKEYGINVWIHRPSTIIREGADAENAAAQLDWMNALVAYMRKTKAVPKIKHIRGALDLVYVKNAANDILSCVLNNTPKSSTSGVSYAHQVGDIVLPLDALQDYIAESGVKVEVLPISDWAARAVKAGLHPAIGALIESMDDPGSPDYPRMLRGETD